MAADAPLTRDAVYEDMLPGEHVRLRLALELGGHPGAERTMITLRAYINLSDVLELLGRHAEAAQTAAAGIEVATKTGATSTLGSYLIGNRADSLLRMGQLDEADELTAQASPRFPKGSSAPPCTSSAPRSR